MKLKDRAKRLKKDIPLVFLCLKSQETPWPAKLFAGLAIVYALSPIDLIPDFIPILGYLDDVIILPLLITLAIKLIPENLLEKKRQEAEGLWDGERPKKWYYSIPIILIWLGVIYCIIVKIIE